MEIIVFKVVRATRTNHKEDQESLVSAGQRRINLIWERTQQVIALVVVFTTLAVASFKAISDAIHDAGNVAAGPAFIFMVAASNLVIGFYFGRTNHQRNSGPVGGPGVDGEVTR